MPTAQDIKCNESFEEGKEGKSSPVREHDVSAIGLRASLILGLLSSLCLYSFNNFLLTLD